MVSFRLPRLEVGHEVFVQLKAEGKNFEHPQTPFRCG